MRVSFHATIRDAIGISDIEMDADTLRNLIEKLSGRFGEHVRDMLIAEGVLRDDVVILVNGRNITHMSGLDTELGPTDEVAIFPPVSGG